MKRALIVLAMLAGSAQAQDIVFRPAGGGAANAGTKAGLEVLTKTVTISAERQRSLFSDPLEFLPSKPGYVYWPTYCVYSHPAGTPPTTASVTHFGAYWETSLLAACAQVTANIFANDNGGMLHHVGAGVGNVYAQFGFASVIASPLVLRTAGADLGGSSTFDLTFTMDYLEVPFPDANLTLNSTFTGNATGWTLGLGGGAPDWAYSANTVTHGDSGGTAALEPTPTLRAVVVGHTYRVIFTISGWSAGTVTPTIGGTAGTARGADGTFTEDIVASTTGNLLLTPTTTFVGVIDNVYAIDTSAP